MWLSQVEVTAQGDRLSIPIPDFRRDLAARIVPIPGERSRVDGRTVAHLVSRVFHVRCLVGCCRGDRLSLLPGSPDEHRIRAAGLWLLGAGFSIA